MDVFAPDQEPIEVYMMTEAPRADNGSISTNQSSEGTSHQATTADNSENTSITAPTTYGTFGEESGLIPISSQSLRYVFLLVYGARYRLAQINIEEMKTVDFFEELQRRYIQLRGTIWFIPWRYIFSIFVFHYCDFIKVSPSYFNLVSFDAKRS